MEIGGSWRLVCWGMWLWVMIRDRGVWTEGRVLYYTSVRLIHHFRYSVL